MYLSPSTTIIASMSLTNSKILITGCSRGIGLGLVKSFLNQGCTVVATARRPSDSEELENLKSKFSSNLHVYPLDVVSKESHIALKRSLLSCGITDLDIVIANAGKSNPAHPDDPATSSSEEDMLDVFRTNVIGTMYTFQTFHEMLKGSKLLVAISSRLGSLSLAHSEMEGGVTSYRASKAALNSFALSFSVEPDVISSGIKVICMHPGWVQTDMGNAGGRLASLPVEKCCDNISNVLSQASSIQLGGKRKKSVSSLEEFTSALGTNQCVFVNYDGKLIPW
jgi:NAD(P)-dependent dehydrogenase (short-subunit alcohol dehydrogenase family)